MNKWAMVLAGLLSSSILAGAALAADTTTVNKSNVPLVTAAKAGDRAAVQSLLNGIPQKVIAGPEGIFTEARSDQN